MRGPHPSGDQLEMVSCCCVVSDERHTKGDLNNATLESIVCVLETSGSVHKSLANIANVEC